MKIKRVEIIGFGRWSQKKFDFVDDLQVIVGQNEAGKSTLRAFIVGMLFGFPSKKGNNINVYDPKAGGSYGGSLIVLFNNEEVKITRLGRTKSELTITYLDNKTVITNPEKWLAEKLAPLNREMFDSIFNFSQQDLARITQLKAVDLQKLLLNIGAVGSTEWLEVNNDIEKNADKKFAKRATAKRPLNTATKQYTDHEQKLEASNIQVDEYVLEEKNIKKLKQTLSKQHEHVQLLLREVQDLQKLIEQYQLYQDAQQVKVQDNTSGLVISDDDILNLQRLKVSIDMQQENINKLNTQFEENKLQVKPFEVYNPAVELANLEVAYRNLNELISQQKVLRNNQAHLDRQFPEEKIPEPLSKSEHETINNKNKSLLLLVISIVVGIVSFYTVKPFVLFAIGIAVLAAYFFQSNYKQIDLIKKRYGMMPVSEIKSLQADIKKAFDWTQQLIEIDEMIIDKKSQIVENLDPIAQYFQVQVNSDDLELLIVQLTQLNNQHQLQVQNELLMSTQKQQQILADIKQNREYLAQNLSEQDEIMKRHHVTSEDELLYFKREQDNQIRKAQRYQDIMQQIRPEAIKRLQKINNIVELDNQLVISQKTLEQEQQNVLITQAKLSDLQADQHRRTNDDQFLDLQQNLADEQTVLLDQFTTYMTEKMVAQWISKALQLASQNRFPKMQKMAIKYFERLTNGKYVAIKIVEDNLIVINQDTETFKIHELSTGTQEQLYVALRLALSRVVSDIVSVPMLIDDGFINFDVNRYQTMVNILQEVANQQQIFYFTTSVSSISKANVVNL